MWITYTGSQPNAGNPKTTTSASNTGRPDQPISGVVWPIKVKATAYTEVLGFVEGSDLKGTFVLNCDYEINAGTMFGLPPTMNLLTEGTFELKIK